MYLVDKKAGEQQIQLGPIGKRLWAAADYIKEYGWCQGCLTNGQGNVCALGAISHCGFSGRPGATVAYSVAAQALHRYLKQNIAAWNDNPERTKEEVIEALRNAAIGVNRVY